MHPMASLLEHAAARVGIPLAFDAAGLWPQEVAIFAVLSLMFLGRKTSAFNKIKYAGGVIIKTFASLEYVVTVDVA